MPKDDASSASSDDYRSLKRDRFSKDRHREVLYGRSVRQKHRICGEESNAIDDSVHNGQSKEGSSLSKNLKKSYSRQSSATIRSRLRDRPRDRSRNRPGDRPRDRSRNRPGDRPRDGLRDRLRDQPRDGSRDGSRDRSRDRPRDRSRDRSRNRPGDGPRDKLRDRSRDRSRDGSRDGSRDRLRDRLRDRSRDGSRDRSRDRPRDRSRDGSRNRPGDGPRDKLRDRTRDRSRDGLRDRSRDQPRDGSRDGDALGRRRKSNNRTTSESSPSNERKKKRKRSQKYSTNVNSKKNEWGKYGVLQLHDQWSKRQEFQLWLLEIKKINFEMLSSYEEKALFAEFVEDFNTATFPDKKYYDLQLWETSQMKKKYKKKQKEFVFDDERKRANEIQNLRQQRQRGELIAAYEDLKDDADKAHAMTHQQMLLTQMKILYQLGKTEEAEKIKSKLKPDSSRLDDS